MSELYLKAKSHILSLLGDELIGSDALAVFELVKNAYDADAENVDITFKNIGEANQKLIIKDDGHGMDSSIIDSVWLTLGTDFKRGVNRKESVKGRVSLGNKGVGRLAVHKIAKNIELTTKVKSAQTLSKVNLNWQDLIDSEEYIQDIKVKLETLKDEGQFPQGHGTEIILTGFKSKNWNKTKVRDFFRKVNSIKSPFGIVTETDDIFNLNIDLGSKNHWIEDIYKPEEILSRAVFRFEFELDYTKKQNTINDSDDANLSWEYIFNDKGANLLNSKGGRNYLHNSEDILDIGERLNSENNTTKRNLKNSDLKGIGRIRGVFYIFNLDKNMVNLFFENEKTAVRQYIKDNYGIRIYRNGVRVFNYGETQDDWLNLDYQKIQRAGDHFSRKVTLGAINLSLSETHETLIEKTNREGFAENSYYEKLQIIGLEIFQKFEKIAYSDRQLINEFVDGFKPIKKAGLSETIDELQEKISAKGLENEFKPLLGRIKRDYETMRDVMTNSGLSGLNLSIIFHEVERELRLIDKKLDYSHTTKDLENVKVKIKSLVSVVDTFTPLLKSGKDERVSIKSCLERLKVINSPRFEHHKIIFSSPLLTGEVEDFYFSGKLNLVFSAINNLIDNAIYWVGYKTDEQRGVFITADKSNFNGDALIISDTGPGFALESDVAKQPFVTTKEGSMGLGLYLANLVFESMGGELLMIDSSEYEIPKIYSGACIALIFPRRKV